MDQSGNSHYAVHMSQQTLNGHGGYYGRGYEANGSEGNGYSSSAHNGYADGSSADHHAEASLSGTAAEADAGGGADEIVVQDEGAVHDEGAEHADEDLDTAREDGGESAADGVLDVTDAADAAGVLDVLDVIEGQDATEGGAPAAERGGASTSAADRMRELLARSSADHAATERATAAALDDIRQQLADVEAAVAEIRERAAAQRDVADWLTEQFAPQTQRLAGMSATLDGLTAALSTCMAQVSALDGRVTALDTRFERLDERLDDQYDRVSSIDGRVSSIDSLVGTADGRIVALGGQFTDAIAPLAEELRARPVLAEVEDVVTKIVDVAHADLSSRLASLEDTVLTLAEALLRPGPGHAPDAPDAL